MGAWSSKSGAVEHRDEDGLPGPEEKGVDGTRVLDAVGVALWVDDVWERATRWVDVDTQLGVVGGVPAAGMA